MSRVTQLRELLGYAPENQLPSLGAAVLAFKPVRDHLDGAGWEYPGTLLTELRMHASPPIVEPADVAVNTERAWERGPVSGIEIRAKLRDAADRPVATCFFKLAHGVAPRPPAPSPSPTEPKPCAKRFTVSATQIAAAVQLLGDDNPIHTATPAVAPGLLVLGLALQRHFDADSTQLREISARFLSPVAVGERPVELAVFGTDAGFTVTDSHGWPLIEGRVKL
ncbi:MAG: MaoC family dehydratase [Propionibacteriaceae bacterium]|jgi:hypothetical protein|nr:MaoC family dehydratase [Propionibacteriaceae bacterium]